MKFTIDKNAIAFLAIFAVIVVCLILVAKLGMPLVVDWINDLLAAAHIDFELPDPATFNPKKLK